MKTNQQKQEITLFNQERVELANRINFDNDMISLTDLWKEAGSPVSKRQIDWQEKESTKEFIEALSLAFKSAKKALLKILYNILKCRKFRYLLLSFIVTFIFFRVLIIVVIQYVYNNTACCFRRCFH